MNFIRLLIVVQLILIAGCSSFQTTKNVWKGTKQLWGTYVSPPASVDYDDKGTLSKQAHSLANAMIGVDLELSRLERVMHNADKPPTQEWMDNLFKDFPWLSGFAGVKYDGQILGQYPPDSMKNLDFNYLLYEDKKQNSRALRADVQPSALGPEVMLAAPLYDGMDFLGIVASYFDMRALMSFSGHAQDIVVLSPGALLWPGKYDFASTPLSGIDWTKVAKESVSGNCTNANGTFFYQVRYLANLPLIFAVPEKGNFQEGNGSIEQGFAFFPKDREKMTPPPVSEDRKQREAQAKAEKMRFEKEQTEQTLPEAEADQQQAAGIAKKDNSAEINQGSRESVLLRKQTKRSARVVQERNLEGDNAGLEKIKRKKAASAKENTGLQPDESAILDDMPDSSNSVRGKQFERPSPFGPKKTETEQEKKQESSESVKEPQTEKQKINMLPGGRPSPFGPR